jgi:hypothetical protein
MKREKARVARENAMAMRVAGIKVGEGGKVVGMATWVAGERTATARARAMLTKIKEVGEEEGNGEGGKSNGDGKEDGNGK